MNKIANILDSARTLSREERRRLIHELDALDPPTTSATEELPEPFEALRALSGTFHSDFVDIAANKYEHVAAAAQSTD
jgi:hypothetical protein